MKPPSELGRYVRCINNKRILFFKEETPRDVELSTLRIGQIYKVAPPQANDGADLRIIDESGTDYLYPAAYFEPLDTSANGHATKTVSAHVPDWFYGILYAEALAANKSISALAREWLAERLDLPVAA
jgi:hypothetical protein